MSLLHAVAHLLHRAPDAAVVLRTRSGHESRVWVRGGLLAAAAAAARYRAAGWADWVVAVEDTDGTRHPV